MLHRALLQQGIGIYRAPSWLKERADGSALRWRVVALAADGNREGETAWRRLEVP